MKCAWQEYLNLLPHWMRQEVDRQGRFALQELRLRVGQSPQLQFQSRSICLEQRVEREDILFVINTASKFSPWTAETIREGYITACGGHRVGICGQATIHQGRMTGISAVSSVCIRVARDFGDIAPQMANAMGSTLIIGPPGCGKTTLLRDLVRKLSDSGQGSVAVVDERQEIFPISQGQICFDRGKNTDIISGCAKSEGINAVLRSMNPQWIAVDEITAQADTESLLCAGWCGVTLLATAHAGSVADLKSRPVYRPLIENKLFQNVLVLHRDKSWTLERM